MKAKLKMNDNLKFFLINFTLFIGLIGLITYTVMDKKGMFDEKVFVDTVEEREKYARLIDFVQSVKTPTLYDENETNPFTNVLAGYMGGETTNSYIEHKVQHGDLYFSYTALSSLPEYEELIKQVEPVFTDGTVDVYESEGLYIWQDNDVYYLLKEQMDATQPMEVTTNENGEVITTETDAEGNNNSEKVVAPLLTKEEVQKVVASLGNSTFEPNKALETYSAETPILQPTYHVDGKVAAEIRMESIPDTYTVVHLLYDQYSITQSNDFDYTTLVNKETAEKVNLENEVVYLSEDKKQFYYKDETTGISLMLNVQSDGLSNEEVIKVIQSMVYESEEKTEETTEDK